MAWKRSRVRIPSGPPKRFIDIRPPRLENPFARNPRTHPDEQIANIAASIREFGFDSLILVDSGAGILAGHGVLFAEAEPVGSREVGDDIVPEAPADPITRSGDLWLVGRHRLTRGDCRDGAPVARLLDGALSNLAITSPSYARQREYDASGGFRPPTLPPSSLRKASREMAQPPEERLEPVFHVCRYKEIEFRPKATSHESEDVVVYSPANPSRRVAPACSDVVPGRPAGGTARLFGQAKN